MFLTLSISMLGIVDCYGAERLKGKAGDNASVVQTEIAKPKRLTRSERKALAKAEQLAAKQKAEEEAARQAEEARKAQEALLEAQRNEGRKAAIENIVKEPVEISLTGKRAIVVDGETGAVIFNKEADLPWHPASTTKIMAALLVLEKGKLEEVTTVSSSATNLYGGYSSNWLWAGMRFTIDQLLHILLIESDNASCNTLAEYVDGTQSKFVEHMNQRAREMGLAAHFTTPYGHTDEDHYVTARDLYLIARACMNYPAFREIVRTPVYNLQTDQIEVTYRNRNQFVGRDPRVLGVKTGYTSAARCNLVCYAEDKGHSLYTVVMGSPRGEIDYSYPDSKKLIDYGFQVLEKAEAMCK